MTALEEPAGPLAALRYRDFRLLWTGQILSLTGSRMQGAAILWHLYALTHSPAALGAIGLARALPILILAVAGGVVADALDRRLLMLISQSVMATLAAILGIWTLVGLHSVWPIYAVASLTAGAMAFDNPARQSMIPALVPRDRLANAVTLNSGTMQLASIAGPALMGLVIAHYSVGVVYCLNAFSFLAVLTALLFMKTRAGDAERPSISVEAGLAGLRFMRRSHLLLSLMLLDFLATFFSSATALLHVFATKILHVGVVRYGWLVAAPAAGALLGALVISFIPSIRRQGLVILGAVFAYGLATIAFGAARTFWFCFAALAATGTADTVSTVLRHTIRQLNTPDALRGRMTSLNMVFFMGGPQLGEMEAGLVASWFGAPFSVISGGIACLLTVAGVAYGSPQLRNYDSERDALAAEG